ncbi:heparinase II/III family protein [Candidatus Poribacteria bacterium]
MNSITLPFAISVCIFSFLVSDTSLGQETVNQPVSLDLFGELVDMVTPGYLHWDRESGDTVDPHADREDVDNNFGEHKGSIDSPEFSSKVENYAQGNVAEEFAYVYRDRTVGWNFGVPGPGQYVLVTRLWRELQERTDVVLSYNSGGEWIDLPVVEDIQHWGGNGNLVCFLIEVSGDQKSVPIRIKPISGRCLIYRVLLGSKRDTSPFAGEVEHPSLYFRASDLPELKEKVRNGPPKFAYDYMVGQMNWYTNTINRGDSNWQRPQNSAHHVSRSIIQTAFVHAMTGNQEYLDTVVRMIDVVMGWPRDESAIVDLQAGFNVLVRARQLSAMAMVYDWLYHDLPDSKRNEIRKFMDIEANRLYLYNETGVGCTESHNWDPWVAAGYGMVGVALREEHKWSQNWIDSSKRIFRLNLLTSHEDFGYFNNGFTKGLDFAASLYTTTGEDIFTPNDKQLKALMDYRITLLEPQGKGYPQLGDARGGNDPILALCRATFLRDPLSQWYINNLSCGSADQVKSWGWVHMMPMAAVTLYDPEMEEQPPGEPHLSLARSFTDELNLPPTLRSVTIMRTGYDRTSDVQLAFRCGDYAGWHGHPDQGSFVLNAYGEHLIIDRAMGAPYGTPKSDFSKSSLAHSIVLIDGEGQVPYSGPVFHDQEAGHTSQLLHTNFIDYVMADSTVAYRKNPQIGVMDHAYRHFLFVRKPDRHAYVVILDDLQMDDSAHQYEWLLQTSTNSTIAVEGQNHHVIAGEAELHCLTFEPESVDMSQSEEHDIWRTLRFADTDPKQRGLFLNILYPRLEEMPLPETEYLEGDGFIGASVSSEDVFLFATEDGNISGNGVVTDGQIAALGRQDNQLEWFLCIDGTRMEVDGQELFRSDKKVTIALDNSRNGYILAGSAATDHEAPNVTVTFGDAKPITLEIRPDAAVVKHGRLITGDSH